MSSIFIGLVLGAGVFCIYWSFWPRSAPTPKAGRASVADRVRDQLVQAGFETVSPGQLLTACVIVFVVVFLGGYSMTHVIPIAVCFAAMGGYGPLALVAMRARKRRTQLRELWPDAVDNIGLSSASRVGFARSPEPTCHPGPGGVAARLCRLRRGLSHDRTVPRLPHPAQGPSCRPSG